LVEKVRETLALKNVDKEDLVDLRCIVIPPNSHYLYE
jgi:N-acetylglutamate synthase-like GNAT family acetyltransferase